MSWFIAIVRAIASEGGSYANVKSALDFSQYPLFCLNSVKLPTQLPGAA